MFNIKKKLFDVGRIQDGAIKIWYDLRVGPGFSGMNLDFDFRVVKWANP